MAQGDSDRVKEAKKLQATDPRKTEALYKEIISKPPSVTSDVAIREYETALVSLGELYRDEKYVLLAFRPPEAPVCFPSCTTPAYIHPRNTEQLVDLVTKSRTVLSSFAKAKTAKLGMAPQKHPCPASISPSPLLTKASLASEQSASSSISSKPSRTRPTSKSRSPSHV